MVPVGAVCCARRVRVTSRILNKMRFVFHLDFQVMASQAHERASVLPSSMCVTQKTGKRSVTPVGSYSLQKLREQSARL